MESNNIQLENAVMKVTEKINHADTDWTNYSEYRLLSELVSCILGSNTRYEMGKKAINALDKNKLLNKNKIVDNPEIMKNDIHNCLRSSEVKYIYPRAKADCIINTVLNIYSVENTTIRKILSKSSDEYATRELLVRLSKGIGLKQASLFLRNISYAQNLAILDTHVLNYMSLIGLDYNRTKTLTPKQYVIKEKKLVSYANIINQRLSKLDIAIWIVMRLARREFNWMLSS